MSGEAHDTVVAAAVAGDLAALGPKQMSFSTTTTTSSSDSEPDPEQAWGLCAFTFHALRLPSVALGEDQLSSASDVDDDYDDAEEVLSRESRILESVGMSKLPSELARDAAALAAIQNGRAPTQHDFSTSADTETDSK